MENITNNSVVKSSSSSSSSSTTTQNKTVYSTFNSQSTFQSFSSQSSSSTFSSNKLISTSNSIEKIQESPIHISYQPSLLSKPKEIEPVKQLPTVQISYELTKPKEIEAIKEKPISITYSTVKESPKYISKFNFLSFFLKIATIFA
jgi:hypothetical protein